MRVFTGLPLAGEIINRLGEAGNYLKNQYPGLKIVNPEGFHITLFFFGEIPDKKVDHLMALMDDPSLAGNKLELLFRGYGCFPTSGNPRVIYGQIGSGKENISHYREKYIQILNKGGFDTARDNKPFKVHVTLARNKRETLKPTILNQLPPLSEKCILDRLVLFQSVLTPKGARYTPLKTIMFR